MPKRKRYHGFLLADTPRDRVVASWIEEKMKEGHDVAELIKEMIYERATGGDKDNVNQQLTEIRRLLESGVLVRSPDAPDGAEADDLINSLRGFAT